MTDRLIAFDFRRGVFDYAMVGSQFVLDHGIQTALLISFYTDKRAGPGDVLPDEQPGPFGLNTKTGGDRRGWWGDFMTPAARTVLPGQPYPRPAFRYGSRFWMFRRRKMTQALLNDVQLEGIDCTAWIKQDAIASSITMTARAFGDQTIVLSGDIVLADGTPASFRLPVLVGGGSFPLPPDVTDGENGALGVFVLDRDKLL